MWRCRGGRPAFRAEVAADRKLGVTAATLSFRQEILPAFRTEFRAMRFCVARRTDQCLRRNDIHFGGKTGTGGTRILRRGLHLAGMAGCLHFCREIGRTGLAQAAPTVPTAIAHVMMTMRAAMKMSFGVTDRLLESTIPAGAPAGPRQTFGCVVNLVTEAAQQII